jgi:hypothetical protein
VTNLLYRAQNKAEKCITRPVASNLESSNLQHYKGTVLSCARRYSTWCGKSDVSQSWKQFIEYCNWSRCAGWTNWRSLLRENNVQGGVLEQEWIAWGAAPNAQRSVKTPNALTGTHDVAAGLRAGERTTSNCSTPTGIKCAYTMLAWISLRWHYEYLNHALLLFYWWTCKLRETSNTVTWCVQGAAFQGHHANSL